MVISVRPYLEADWPRLCAIHDAARLGELERTVGLAAFIPLEQAAEPEGLFDGELVVAERGGELAGFAAYRDAELTWLYVDPQLGRAGVGRALLRHVIAACGGALSCEVLEGNDPALALYLSEGLCVRRRIVGRLTGNEQFAAVGLELVRRADGLARQVRCAWAMPGSWAGGGTRAIAALPPEAIGAPRAAAVWVGTATIERPAPFSHFPGLTRLHMPVRGGGIRLRFDAPPEVVELGLLRRQIFSGARPLQSEPLAGRLVALNLIVADGRPAELAAFELAPGEERGAPALPAAQLSVVYAARGSVEVLVDGALAALLAEDDALVLRGAPAIVLRAGAEACAAAVALA